MHEEPDVRLDGISHETILGWVHEGQAAQSTTGLESWLQSIISALREAADEVNRAVQKAGAGEWEGTTADSATAALASLRDFDEEMHTHGTADRYSAMGQSDESAATRNRVPPIPLDLDGQHSILGTTVDPKVRIDARRAAEEQARLVMAEYQEATRQRVAGLPRIAPVPAVVLDTSTDEPSGASPDHRRVTPNDPVPARNGGKSATSESGSSAPPPGRPSETPGHPGQAGTTPTAPQAVGQAPAGPAPVGASGAARGDPVTAANPAPAVIGGIAAVPISGNTATPGGEPEVVENKGTGQRAEPGPRSAVERVVEREQVTRETTQRRTSGTGGVMGGAGGTPTDKQDEEHHNRYHLPSEEHFETDEEYLRDGEFFVAPDVIGGPE